MPEIPLSVGSKLELLLSLPNFRILPRTLTHLSAYAYCQVLPCIRSGGSRISERGGQSSPLRGSGGMLPQKILNFRPSEVVSGAFWVENCFLQLL